MFVLVQIIHCIHWRKLLENGQCLIFHPLVLFQTGKTYKPKNLLLL